MRHSSGAIFNPPPNWPAPPAGWHPPPGWSPDPAWGPAPTRWPLWLPPNPHPVRDSAFAAAVVYAAGLLLLVSQGDFRPDNVVKMLFMVALGPGLLTALLARRAHRTWSRGHFLLITFGFAALAIFVSTLLYVARAAIV